MDNPQIGLILDPLSKKALAFSMLLLMGLSALAQDGDWNVDTNGNWSVGANWNPAGGAINITGTILNADSGSFGGDHPIVNASIGSSIPEIT